MPTAHSHHVCCLLSGGLLWLATVVPADQSPTPPTAQAFAAIKASPPAQADPNNPWTGLWRGKLRGRQSNASEFRQFHDERIDDVAVVLIQKDDGVWVEGNTLTSPFSMLGGDSRPVCLKLNLSNPAEATAQKTELALDGKLTSELKLQAKRKGGQLCVIIRSRVRGTYPLGLSTNSEPIMVSYSLDAVATLDRVTAKPTP